MAPRTRGLTTLCRRAPNFIHARLSECSRAGRHRASTKMTALRVAKMVATLARPRQICHAAMSAKTTTKVRPKERSDGSLTLALSERMRETRGYFHSDVTLRVARLSTEFGPGARCAARNESIDNAQGRAIDTMKLHYKKTQMRHCAGIYHWPML